ncbi:MAG: GAF domain-containing protein [Anaerolineaceae bacterium]|nr:GAF domain-containing protein [Anaerolineaceae bacterium]
MTLSIPQPLSEKLFNLLLQQLSEANELGSLQTALAQFAAEEWAAELTLSFQPSVLEHNLTEKIAEKTLLRQQQNCQANRQIISHQERKTAKTSIFFPLVAGNEVFGSLALTRQNNPFNADEKEAIKVFCGISAAALQSIRLLQVRDYQERVIELIASLSSKLAGITKLDNLMKEACRLIAADLHYYYVSIFIIDEENDALVFRASAGSRKAGKLDPLALKDKIFAGQHIIGTVAASGNSLLIPDVHKEPLYYSAEGLPETQSELAIPLKVGSKILGVLDLQSDKKNGFSQADLTLLRAVADSIALAIHRVSLYASLELRTDQLDLIARVSKSLTGVLDLDTLLSSITRMMHDEFDYQEVHIFLVEHAPLRIQHRAGSGKLAKSYQKSVFTIDPNSQLGLIPEAIRTGKIQYVNDVSEEPKYLPNPLSKENVGSELSIPLEFGGVVFGVLDVQDDKTNAFSENDVELLTTLSANISIAVRNASLYNTQKWRSEVAESLRDIALSLAKSLPLEETINKILSGIMSVLPCELALVALFKADEPKLKTTKPNLKLQSYQSQNGISLLPGLEINTESAWFMQGFETLHPVIRDPRMPDDIIRLIGFTDEASAISAPLTVGNEAVGVLILYHSKPYRFGAEASRLASTWSGYLGIALENQQLEEETQEQSWLSTILLQVALSSRSLTDVEELTRVMAQLMILLIGGRAGGLITYDSENKSFTFEARFGSDDAPKICPLEIKDTKALEKAMESQTLTALPAQKMDPQISALMGLQANSTVLLMPLAVHNETLGLLMHIGNLDYIDLPPSQVLGKQALAILKGIAQQTALSLQNILLVSAVEEENMIASLLLQISKLLVGSSSLKEGLGQVIRVLYDTTGFDNLAFLSYNPDRYEYRIEHAILDKHRPMHFDQNAVIKEKLLPAYQIFASPEAKIMPFETFGFLLSSNHSSALAAKHADFADSRWIVVPSMAQNEHYGLILALDGRLSGQKERIELLKGASQQLASALQNAQFHHVQHQQSLVEKELNLARQIQKNFLPESLPEIQGYDLAVSWQTARQVGGDFYDVFKINERYWGFVIADVSDKGLPAALYMTVARTLIKAMGLETLSPAKTLQKVNHLLQLDSKEGFFITSFYGVLDLQQNLMNYCIAGHNPPVLLSAQTRQALMLQKGELALGILDPVAYADRCIRFAAGDSLVLYTDGVTEMLAENGAFFGNERLLATLQKGHAENPPELVQRLSSALAEFKGKNPPNDDVTILVLKRR